jgi:hypothetical protein
MIDDKLHYLYNENTRVKKISFYKILRKLNLSLIIPKEHDKFIMFFNVNGDNNVDIIKKCDQVKKFCWFGYNLSKGNYIISFNFEINRYIDINEIHTLGFKTHNPDILYSNFLLNKKPNTKHSEILHINNNNNGLFIFILDKCKKINIKFDEINIYKFHE